MALEKTLRCSRARFVLYASMPAGAGNYQEMSTVNIIYNMDCMLAMRDIPDKAFDLAVVDPPYGINAPNMSMGTNKTRSKGGYSGVSVAQKLRKGRLNSGGGKLKNRALQTMPITWDYAPPPKEYFTELFRVSKNQIIFGGNYFDLPPTRGIICWDKCQPWENFSQWEMAWTSFDCPAALFRFSNTGGKNDERKIHPTQKPVALYRWIFGKYAKSGDKILDTHLGSGSSRIAAYEAGLDFVGYEIDKTYFDLQEQRFADFTAQGKLEGF